MIIGMWSSWTQHKSSTTGAMRRAARAGGGECGRVEWLMMKREAGRCRNLLGGLRIDKSDTCLLVN
eukprot:scaffold6868_cov120-Skeletonema_marinoi.AAC.3